MKNIALITGASKGIGRALAIEFAKRGFSLILIAQNTAELESLQKEVRQHYQCNSKTFSIDLAHPDSVDQIVHYFAEEMPEVTVLINDAGLGFANPLTNMTAEQVLRQVRVNIEALTKLTHRVLPFMVARKRGRILNVASTAAFSPGPFMSIYFASKAYVLSFSEAIREEYRKQGVMISVLCPGVTRTAFHARAGMMQSWTMKLLTVMTPEKVAKIGCKGVLKGKRVIIPGIMNKVNAFLMALLPSRVIVIFTGFLNKP